MADVERIYNGALKTFENNCMCLSCAGSATIKNNIIIDVSFKGIPRTCGDSWVVYYEGFKRGDFISEEIIDGILSFNGKNNVISKFEEKE